MGIDSPMHRNYALHTMPQIIHTKPTAHNLIARLCVWPVALALALSAVMGSHAYAQSAPTATSTLDRIKARGKVLLAHRDASVPFSYLDGNKKPIGYAMDLCERLVKMLEKELKQPLKIEYVLVTSATRIDAIAKSQADMECGSTTNNAERRQKVAFTIPHYIAGARLMVRADSPINRFEDLEGQKLVSTKGSTPLKLAEEQIKSRRLWIPLVEAPDHAKAVQMVESGEADAFLMDDILLYGLRANRPKPEALKVVGNFLSIEALAIMLPKDDPRFKELVDNEMKRIIRSGEIYAIYRTWFEQPIPPKNANLQLPMSFLMKDFYKYPNDFVP
jgi:glutamate/aspartate transport system substrate-binding protein